VIRNRTWDAGRATVGPHVAAISGQRRSLRVSPTSVCSAAHAGRGILPSWSCEFDSRHPLHVKALVKSPFAMPPCFCVTARRGRAITRAIGFRPHQLALEPQLAGRSGGPTASRAPLMRLVMTESPRLRLVRRRPTPPAGVKEPPERGENTGSSDKASTLASSIDSRRSSFGENRSQNVG
jgi:hypothetical protein